MDLASVFKDSVSWLSDNKELILWLVTVAIPALIAVWRDYEARKRAKTAEEKNEATEALIDSVEKATEIATREIINSVPEKDKPVADAAIKLTVLTLKDHIKSKNLIEINRKVAEMFPKKEED